MTTEGEVALVTRALEAAPVTASGVAMANRKKGQNKINAAVVTDTPAEPLPGEEPQVIEAPAQSSAARGLLTLPVLK